MNRYWYWKIHQHWIYCKIFFECVNMLKVSHFHEFLNFPVLGKNKWQCYISRVTLFQFVSTYYLWLTNFVNYIYLCNRCKYMIVYLILIKKIYVYFFHWTHKTYVHLIKKQKFINVYNSTPMGYMQDNVLQNNENNINIIIQRHINTPIIK